jgi:hypothetical protein
LEKRITDLYASGLIQSTRHFCIRRSGLGRKAVSSNQQTTGAEFFEDGDFFGEGKGGEAFSFALFGGHDFVHQFAHLHCAESGLKGSPSFHEPVLMENTVEPGGVKDLFDDELGNTSEVFGRGSNFGKAFRCR